MLRLAPAPLRQGPHQTVGQLGQQHPQHVPKVIFLANVILGNTTLVLTTALLCGLMMRMRAGQFSFGQQF